MSSVIVEADLTMAVVVAASEEAVEVASEEAVVAEKVTMPSLAWAAVVAVTALGEGRALGSKTMAMRISKDDPMTRRATQPSQVSREEKQQNRVESVRKTSTG